MIITTFNTTCMKGSTGKIAADISNLAIKKGHICEIIYSYGETGVQHSYAVQSKNRYFINNFMSRTLLGEGCTNYYTTKKVIKKFRKQRPYIIHLNNLHGHYMHCGLLFDYIKQNKIRTVWTLHDCWAFTGQCPHFTMVKCDKWKTGCYDCPQYREYPAALVDRTKTMWKLKKEWFTEVENMTIVTPSQWLADLVKQSFLKDYSVKVIHNGIDLNIFKPTSSSFKERYGITEKHIVLGVAFGWGKRKGLDVFVELSRRLPPEYQIVLVGTDDSTDKLLPDNIISIHRTQNQKELAEIYTAASVFANPTREEVLGMVNLEALACGTSVVTFNTGGSPECITEKCGCAVECDDINAMEEEIIRICETHPYSEESCVERAKLFDMNDRFVEYIKLYEELNV